MMKNNDFPAPFGRNYALFLDVDGTLADFQADPAAVSLSPSVLRLMSTLHRQLHGALALVSGRSNADLTRMCAGQPLCCVGLHGLTQNENCPGTYLFPTPSWEMEDLRRDSLDFCQQHSGVMMEDKEFSLALHYRCSPHSQAAVRQFAREYLQRREGRSDFVSLEGNMVVEFRPAGVDKGRGIQRLLQHEPFKGRMPVFIGDDVTDEAGFAVVNAAGGVSIKCGVGDTCAQFRLADVASVQQWLKEYSAFLLRM